MNVTVCQSQKLQLLDILRLKKLHNNEEKKIKTFRFKNKNIRFKILQLFLKFLKLLKFFRCDFISRKISGKINYWSGNFPFLYCMFCMRRWMYTRLSALRRVDIARSGPSTYRGWCLLKFRLVPRGRDHPHARHAGPGDSLPPPPAAPGLGIRNIR